MSDAPKLLPIHIVGPRPDGSQTLGTSAASGAALTLTILQSRSVKLTPVGGTMNIRRATDAAADDVVWPANMLFDAKGFYCPENSSQVIPDLVVTIADGTTVYGTVESGHPPTIA